MGAACLSLAAKIEEIHPPLLEDFAVTTDGGFSKADIRNMEYRIVEVPPHDSLVPPHCYSKPAP